jgi:hypothetical protein
MAYLLCLFLLFLGLKVSNTVSFDHCLSSLILEVCLQFLYETQEFHLMRVWSPTGTE